MCSFCNQKSISGTLNPTTAEETVRICEQAYEQINDKSETEIAFFGGSFTAIPLKYMTELLECVQQFIGENGFKGIRISTRPDCIDENILDILKKYHVTSIELGAQSMSDEVLFYNERGHSADDVRNASALIKEYGFELGLQMMVGLYKSTPELDRYTADEIIKLSPKTVRIYPVVILEGTELSRKFISGEYIPMDFETAVGLSAEIYMRFIQQGINVIKLGLHASETVGAQMIGGFYHPAFRELCEGILFRKKIGETIKRAGNYIVYVPEKSLSKAVGQKKSNLVYFKSKGINLKIKPSEKLKDFDIKVTEEV